MQRGRALGHHVLEAVAAVRHVLHSGLDGAHDGADGVHAEPLHAAWAAAAARLRALGRSRILDHHRVFSHSFGVLVALCTLLHTAELCT